MKKKSTSKKDTGLYLSKTHQSAIEKTEDVGTAAMRTGAQIILAMEEIMSSDFGLSETQIKQMETKLKWMLRTLYDLKRESLTVMNMRDMEVVGKLAERWLAEDKVHKSGLILPDDVKQKLIKH